MLFQIFSDCNGKCSLIVTSDLTIVQWASVFSAAALLDRRTYHCSTHEFDWGKHPLHGKSGRRQQTEKETQYRRKGRLKNACATACVKCRCRGNPPQSALVSAVRWKPSAPILSTAPATLLMNH